MCSRDVVGDICCFDQVTYDCGLVLCVYVLPFPFSSHCVILGAPATIIVTLCQSRFSATVSCFSESQITGGHEHSLVSLQVFFTVLVINVLIGHNLMTSTLTLPARSLLDIFWSEHHININIISGVSSNRLVALASSVISADGHHFSNHNVGPVFIQRDASQLDTYPW